MNLCPSPFNGKIASSVTLSPLLMEQYRRYLLNLLVGEKSRHQRLEKLNGVRREVVVKNHGNIIWLSEPELSPKLLSLFLLHCQALQLDPLSFSLLASCIKTVWTIHCRDVLFTSVMRSLSKNYTLHLWALLPFLGIPGLSQPKGGDTSVNS